MPTRKPIPMSWLILEYSLGMYRHNLELKVPYMLEVLEKQSVAKLGKTMKAGNPI